MQAMKQQREQHELQWPPAERCESEDIQRAGNGGEQEKGGKRKARRASHHALRKQKRGELPRMDMRLFDHFFGLRQFFHQQHVNLARVGA